MTIKEICENKKDDLSNDIKQIDKILKHTEKIGSGFNWSKFKLRVDGMNKLEIVFTKLSDLRYIRKHFKKAFPSYSDSLHMIFENAGNAHVYYIIPEVPIELLLRVPMNELPKQYTKNGKCGFVKRQTTDYNFVCKNEGGE